MKKIHYKEGIDYTIHEYIRKKKRTSEKAICPICSQCKSRRICLNRKSKETMDRCNKCKTCTNAENCDKFYIYSEYRAEILRLGTNPNNGKPIRQQLTGTNREKLVKKVIARIIKNQEEGIKEKVYKPNEDSIITIAKEIEEQKYKDRITKGAGYNRNMQTIKAISSYNFALKPIQYVTRGEIERFLECERNKANSTIGKEYRILKRVFEKAYAKKKINDNYFAGYEAIKKPISYKEDKDVKAFTIFEQYQFIAYLQTHPSKYNNILLLSLFTGMRIGEVLALKLQDIDIDLNYISVNQTMTKDKHDKIIIGNTPKTKNGKRKIKVLSQAKPILENSIKEMIPNKDNLLFIRSDNKYYEDGQVNSAFKRICMNAGIRVKNSKHKKYSDKKGFYYVNQKTSDVNTHMLRHSFATRGIEAGMTSTVLKDILGHSDIQTTINIYGDVFSYYQNSESEKAEKYLEEQMNKYEERFKLIEKNSREKVVNL